MSRGHFLAATIAATVALALPAAASADTLNFNFPLKGWWPLNEGSGQIVHDYSGNNNNGYLGSTNQPDANDPSWIKGVFAGSALNFGGDDWVTIPDSSSLEPANLTVAAWVRNNGSPGNNMYVLSKGSFQCNYASYGLYTGDNGGIAFYVGGQSTFYKTAQGAPSIWDGSWHHVAGTFDGRYARLYVDGQLIGSPTPVPEPINYNIDGGGLVGSYGACNGSLSLNGDIDGVQIWSQALPVDTIWKLLKPLFSLAK
jgi:hypothetical protein